MSLFALVDCNNFFASCEKILRPDLENKPVIVLSNNDGCVVARSKEAKALGIKMGVPFFQIESEVKEKDITVFSSNFELYSEVSHHVMEILEEMVPKMEVYSIDEAFLDLGGISQEELLPLGKKIRQTILDQTKITVCIGIAPTKTLAKLANEGAKQYPKTGGVVDLTDPERQKRLMKIMPVEEVWGVGRRLAPRLHELNIHTALDLANQNPSFIKSRFSVVLERTVLELNGTSCIELEEDPAPQKQILYSRSFGERITKYEDMKEAVSTYVGKAAEKLRKEKQWCKRLSLKIRTGLHNPNEKKYSNSDSASFVLPTQDTREMLSTAFHLLEKLWKPNYRYAKASVMLSDFYDAPKQSDLFDVPDPKAEKLMATIDEINQKIGVPIFLGSDGLKKNWKAKQEKKSSFDKNRLKEKK